VLDKTGTVTEGKPSVTDIIPLDPGWPANELLRVAAAVERNSEHPLAEAIVQHARQRGLAGAESFSFESLTGRGARARVDEADVIIGSERLLGELGIATTAARSILEKLSAQARTPVLIAIDGNLAGVIAIADVIQASAKEAVARLRAYRLRVIMLTGDSA